MIEPILQLDDKAGMRASSASPGDTLLFADTPRMTIKITPDVSFFLAF
jgi:hypothetical protein